MSEALTDADFESLAKMVRDVFGKKPEMQLGPYEFSVVRLVDSLAAARADLAAVQGRYGALRSEYAGKCAELAEVKRERDAALRRNVDERIAALAAGELPYSEREREASGQLTEARAALAECARAMQHHLDCPNGCGDCSRYDWFDALTRARTVLGPEK